MSGVWTIVPVKSLESAKSRLAPAYDPAARKLLVLAMLRDVLAAVRSAGGSGGLCVVTSDRHVAKIAEEMGAVVLPDPPQETLSDAYNAGIAFAIRAEAAGVLLVSADLPLARARDISAMKARSCAGPFVRLAAATYDGGTNAMAMWPPDIIPPTYGEGSLARHLRAAAKIGIACDLPHLPALGLDIDRPEDVQLLNGAEPGPATREALRIIGLQSARCLMPTKSLETI